MADEEETQEEEEAWIENASQNKIVQLVALGIAVLATRGGAARWAGTGKMGSGLAKGVASNKGTAVIGSGGLISLIDEWFFSDDDDNEKTDDEVLDQAVDNGLKTLVEEKVKERGPITSADGQNDLITEVATEAGVSVAQAKQVVDATELQELSTPGPGMPDPSGQTTWLVSDAYLNNTMDPTTFAFNTDYLPFRKGQDATGLRGSQDYTGMLGTQDIQFYAARPQVEGGGRGSAQGSQPEFLSWTMDGRKLPDGYEFISVVEKDVPFTIGDAMGIYDKQDAEGKRKIAQALALGDAANGSFLMPVLGREMFSNPDSIYDRDVVEAGMIEMSNAAAVRARNLSGGYADLGERFNPTTVLDKPDSLGVFQDQLFDMAVDVGMVTQIAADYGQKLAERVLTNLTGLQDIEGFSGLVETWIPEIQRENMGRSLSQAEIETGLEVRMEETPQIQEAISSGRMAIRRAHLGRAMAGTQV